jgi:hypothetical protein
MDHSVTGQVRFSKGCFNDHFQLPTKTIKRATCQTGYAGSAFSILLLCATLPFGHKVMPFASLAHLSLLTVNLFECDALQWTSNIRMIVCFRLYIYIYIHIQNGLTGPFKNRAIRHPDENRPFENGTVRFSDVDCIVVSISPVGYE